MAKYKRTLVTPAFTVAQVVLFKVITGEESTLHVISGNLWVDLEGRTDLTTSNGFKLTANSALDLKTIGSISLLSDVTTASVQILEWGI
jgi:uncharacterized protein YaiE (UPF0345 family)